MPHPDQYLPLTGNPLASTSQIPESLPCSKQDLWQIELGGSRTGAIFPPHTQLMKSPPFTQLNLGQFEPDEPCWPPLMTPRDTATTQMSAGTHRWQLALVYLGTLAEWPQTQHQYQV